MGGERKVCIQRNLGDSLIQENSASKYSNCSNFISQNCFHSDWLWHLSKGPKQSERRNTLPKHSVSYISKKSWLPFKYWNLSKWNAEIEISENWGWLPPFLKLNSLVDSRLSELILSHSWTCPLTVFYRGEHTGIYCQGEARLLRCQSACVSILGSASTSSYGVLGKLLSLAFFIFKRGIILTTILHIIFVRNKWDNMWTT